MENKMKIEDVLNNVWNEDGLEFIKKMPDKSVNLICIDPPYNIGKDEWDVIPDYYDWMSGFFVEFERILKDNGSFFMFHNDFRILSELDRQIQDRTKFVYKNFIVWNKRFDGSPKKGFLDGYVVVEGLNNFQKMAEYVMYYTFDNSWKLSQRRKELGITQMTIGKEIPSKTGGFTGWYSNIEIGKNYPTEETIKPITKHLGLTIDDIVPKFRNQKSHHSVWNYDLDHKKFGHVTPKPIDLLKNIILHTTDENDICLDCFGGSGSLGVAAIQTNRKFILVEKDIDYCKIASDRLKGESSLKTVKNDVRKRTKTEIKNILNKIEKEN
jgi:site-specific DNA-methyltransferase (adenine-specific)